MPMKKQLQTTFISIFLSCAVHGQFFTQYFDGADTIPEISILVEIDAIAGNIWQIGPPQTNIFTTPFTTPNVIITDTINNYPVNNVSRFTYNLNTQFPPGIVALQWIQKLDLESDHDGAIIEYSTDMGQTWFNVFNDPFVYNFYGFDPANADTLVTGEYAFSGTDTTWKNIWLCFDASWMGFGDTMMVRHTLLSDSANTGQEGWMIDNMMAALTIVHTLGEETQKEYLKVFPTVTNGIVNIMARKVDGFHIIENLEVYNSSGQLVKNFKNVPTKFWVDLKGLPAGNY